MTQHNRVVGSQGERTAADYLTARGYQISARNVRTPYGEIDIVARLGEITIFIEVKTRTSNKMGWPEESITLRKQQHMLSCASYYAQTHGIDNWQIDVISVETAHGNARVTHFQNAL